MFPIANPFKIIRAASWVLMILVILYIIYVVFINVYAYFTYSPQNVVNEFVTLIENPTDKITEEEKNTLKEITDNSWLNSWWNENNIKTLREVAQKNPVIINEIKYEGSSQRNARVELGFNNNFKNPNSKKATLYLQKSGKWYLNGQRWRIFQIDMPRSDNPTDNLQGQIKTAEDKVKEGAQSISNQIKHTWDNIFGDNKSQPTE